VKYADGSTISFALDHSEIYRVQLGIDADTGFPFYERIVGWAVVQADWSSAEGALTRLQPVIIDGGLPLNMFEYYSRKGIDEAWYVVHAKDVAGHD
jgi:hypothetical protein